MQEATAAVVDPFDSRQRARVSCGPEKQGRFRQPRSLEASALANGNNARKVRLAA